MPAWKTLFLFLVISGFLLSGCKQQPGTSPGRTSQEKSARKGPVLADVAGAIITVDDFEEEIRSMPEYTRKRMNTQEEQRKLLDKMIEEILLLQEGQRRGLDRDDDIQAKVERYRRRLITEKLYQEVARERSRVGEEEIQEYFEAHKDRFLEKERIRASQILILVPPNAGPEKEMEARKKAEEALRRAKAGEDFAELVKQYSEGPAAANGGDLGYFSRGRMVPEFEEIAFSLQNVGDTSDLVRTKFGYHIIRLTGRQPAQELPLSEVHDRIIRQLESAKRREIRQSLADELRQAAKVEIHPERLNVKEPTQGAASAPGEQRP
jgi:peptidyl-prolyl cis-trans isomerase C